MHAALAGPVPAMPQGGATPPTERPGPLLASAPSPPHPPQPALSRVRRAGLPPYPGEPGRGCLKNTSLLGGFLFRMKERGNRPIHPFDKMRGVATRLWSSKQALSSPIPGTTPGTPPPPPLQQPGRQPARARDSAYRALFEQGWILVPSLCFSLGDGLMPWN